MASSIPSNKTELLAAIEKSFKKTYQLLVIIPPELAYEETLMGCTNQTPISVHNLLAYLVGWNELVLKWLKLSEQNQPIDLPETGFTWKQLDLLAQKFYVDYQLIPYSELLTHFLQVKEQLVQQIIALNNKQLYEVTWHHKYTMGRIIQLNTSSHYKNAYNRLKSWLKTHHL